MKRRVSAEFWKEDRRPTGCGLLCHQLSSPDPAPAALRPHLVASPPVTQLTTQSLYPQTPLCLQFWLLHVAEKFPASSCFQNTHMYAPSLLLFSFLWHLSILYSSFLYPSSLGHKRVRILLHSQLCPQLLKDSGQPKVHEYLDGRMEV